MRKLLLLLLLLPILAFGQQTYREFALQNTGVARTTTGNGADVDTGVDSVEYRQQTSFLIIEVTAVSGTSPTMTVSVECRNSSPLRYAPLATSVSITATGNYGLQIPHTCRFVRLQWTIGGTTPSFTFGAWLHRV